MDFLSKNKENLFGAMKLPPFVPESLWKGKKHSSPTSELKGFINDAQFFSFYSLDRFHGKRGNTHNNNSNTPA